MDSKLNDQVVPEPVARLSADLEAGSLQKLAQIEPDDRFVLGDEQAHGCKP